MTISAISFVPGQIERPFITTPNPRFFARFGQYNVALNHAIGTVVERYGLTIIAGPIGCGKSTLSRFLVEWLADHLADQVNLVYLSNPNLSTDLQLLKAICKGLELPLRPTKAEQMDVLKAYLVAQDALGKRTVLLVDEAHKLTGPQFELIRELFNFAHNDHFHIQVILAGEEGPLRHKLKNKKALVSRAMYYDTLSPLEPTEVEELVRFRLRTSGQDEHMFTAAALAAIATASRGLPRTVVKLCHHALERAQSFPIDAPAIAAVLAANPRIADAV